MNLWAFLTSLFIIAAAEIGDKTFLLTFGLATRFPWIKIILMIFAATGLLMAAIVFLGGAINYFIPTFYIQLAAGILFVLFGLWMALGKEGEEKKAMNGSLWVVFIAFLLAELGDKTQLAKLTLSAKYGIESSFAVWLGATLGMAGVDSLGVVVGGWMKRFLPEKIVKWIAVSLFIGFGLVTLGDLLVW